MECSIWTSFDQVSGYVDEVSAIADQNKGVFGFLAASVYEQMASKGQLWIAVNGSNDLVGYLMFGGTMPILKVFQLYASKLARGQGVATQLLDELKAYARNKNYHSISARVASDLPANNFWSSVGFSIFRQVKGGKTTKRIINIRGYSLSENDLFGSQVGDSRGVKPTGPVLKQSVYAIDLNLLLDAFKGRPGFEKTTKIMQVGFQGKFSVCVTPEFKKELARNAAGFTDDPVLRLADAFPVLRVDGDISAIAESLKETVFPFRASTRKSAQNDESDLMHLAYCITAGVDGFITREKAMLRACSDINDKYNVSILSPDELIFDEGEWLDIATPLNSDFAFSPTLVTAEVMGFIDGFTAPTAITNILTDESPIKDTLSVYEARLDGCLFGVYFSQKPIKTTFSALAALYIDESSPKSVAAIDHFLETALRHRNSFSYRLDLYIGKDQYFTEETLLKKGFFKSGDHFVKIICNMFLDVKTWERFSKDVRLFCGFSIPERLPTKKELVNTGVCFTDSKGLVEAFSWFDFETIIGPRFILNTDRCCILVSIRENYAAGLIGSVRNQLSLLSSGEQTLLLEKAYFRSSAKADMFQKGGLIAFYVSGNKSIQEIVGFARITYSDVIDVDEAAIMLGRQGVLTRDELVNTADRRGKIHVFTFDNFFEFDRRVTFSRAKALGLISDANLVSPEKIELEKLKILIREAFNE